MKDFKKVIALFLCAAMSISLIACSKESPADNDDDEPEVTEDEEIYEEDEYIGDPEELIDDEEFGDPEEIIDDEEFGDPEESYEDQYLGDPEEVIDDEEFGDPEEYGGPISELTAVMIPGELIYISDDGYDVIHGLDLEGNIAGSSDFNTRGLTNDDVRCIFELNEWIDFYLDSEAEDISVYVMEHDPDWDSYVDLDLSENAPGVIEYCYLDPADDLDVSWGSMYLDPEIASSGYYDLIFQSGTHVVAALEVRFYDEGDLGFLGDEDLEAIMRDIF
ncbi:MAG: hypothetical protein J5685_01185 [Clostridiales bacterium]|nr:hypothetical protein [Clostridiales bacterium]